MKLLPESLSADAMRGLLVGRAALHSSLAMQSIHGILATCGLLLTLLGVARAQTWDGFDPAADAPVRCLALQADGKVVIGGDFATVGGATRNRIARLNADGNADAGCDQGANGTVHSIALQADGKVIIGGDFTIVGGFARRHLARLNADGTLDPDFNAETDGQVLSLAVQADGKVLVGGGFTMIGGAARNHLARLHADGSPDVAFNPNCNSKVRCLTVQSDGAILLGGDFTVVGGASHSGLARLKSDGSPEPTFKATANGAVGCLAVQPDGKILLGGSFTIVGGTTRNHLARLHADGTLDADFNPDANGEILTLAVPPDGGILTGGSFTTMGGATCKRLARLTANGTRDAAFNPNPDGVVRCLALLDNGKVLVGGDFTLICNTQQRDRLERLNADGSSDVFSPKAANVTPLAVQADGRILAVALGNNLYRMNADGSTDVGFTTDAKGGTIACLAVQADDKILVAGPFGVLSGKPRYRLLRLTSDGMIDPAFNLDIDNPVASIALQADGKILIGGTFTTVGGIAHSRLARLHVDGTPDATFVPSANNSVSTIAVQPDGMILLGGAFTTVNGVARNRIARLNADGTLDASFNPNASGSVACFVVQPDGMIVVGGAFTTLGGTPRSCLARLHADGTLDANFNPNVAPSGITGVKSLALQTNGQVLIGGDFSTVGGDSHRCLARVNPDGSPDQELFTDVDTTVSGLALQANGKILLGGNFTMVNDGYCSGMARLRNPLAAYQTLSVTGGDIDWKRSGSAAEVDQVTFEIWTGNSWTSLGPAVRTANGWRMTGASVPAGTWLRAVGRASGGPSLIAQVVLHGTGPVPEIAVRESATTSLISGTTTVDYGNQDWDGTVRKTFTISNEGTADLTGLALALKGEGTACFSLGTLDNTVLVPGASTTFTADFSPMGYGQRTAAVSITCNDVDEHPFTFGLTGMGIHQDPGFNPNVSSAVYSVAVQPDGKILIGGDFYRVGGVTRNWIARVSADGSVDMGFDPNANGRVSCLSVLPDGKILIGGSFSAVGGLVRNRLARLNPDGSVDPGFRADANNDVQCMVSQNDGKILVGGGFTTVNGVARKYVARLNSDGAVDPGFSADPNVLVQCLVLQPDGRILLGGLFSKVSGMPHNKLARLNADGSVDAGFVTQADQSISAMALLPDGRIYICGDFTTVGGLSRNKIARLNPDGSVDTSFIATPNSSVTTLAVQADGRILIAGNFTAIGGVTRHGFARLTADGTLDPAINSEVAPICLGLQADGGILVGGYFSVFGGVARNKFARLPNNISATSSLTVTVPGQLDWNCGGSLPEFAQVTFENWNGNAWEVLGAGVRVADGWQASGLNLPVSAWLRARGSAGNGVNYSLHERTVSYGAGTLPKLVVRDAAGGVLNAGTSTVDFGIQDWNTLGPSKTFTITNAGSAALAGLAVSLAGSAPADFVLGNLDSPTLAPGASTTFTASFSPTGTNNRSAALRIASNDPAEQPFTVNLTGYGVQREPGYDPVLTAGAICLAMQPDGKAVVGGYFTTADGATRRHLARLNADGSLDAGFKSGVEGSVGTVSCLAIQADGKILLGGDLTSVSGLSRNSIARLNADGSVDAAFNPGANNMVNAIAVQPDGKILVGGSFTTIGGTTRNRIARLNADGTVDPAFNPNASSTVCCILPLPTGQLLIGGYFATVGGVARTGLARLNADGSLDSSFNSSTAAGILCLAVQADGGILIAGDFITAGGVTHNRIARLHADATLDASFNPDSNNKINCLATQADGRILLGGTFTAIGGTNRNRLARLNADGSLDSGFDPNADAEIRCLALQRDGKVLAGGVFKAIGGIERNYLVRLPNNISAVSTLAVTGDQLDWTRGGSTPEVAQVSVETWHAGEWLNLGAATRVADGWHMTGLSLSNSTWLRVRGHVSSDGTDGSMIEQVVLQGSGSFPNLTVSDANGAGLASGTASVDFGTRDWNTTSPPAILTLTNTGGAPLTGLTLSLGGENAADFAWAGPGATSLAPGASTTLSVSFSPKGSGTRSAAVLISSNDLIESPFRVSLTGYCRHQDPGFNPEANGTVVGLALQADGRLVIGGTFTTVNGTARNRIARLNGDGTLDASFDPNANDSVSCLAVQRDGGIIIGGAFTTVGGVSRNHIARLNADGTVDPDFDPNAAGSVNCLVVQPDGTILMAGAFTGVGSGGPKYVARLNADGSVDPSFNPNASGTVWRIVVQTDGKLLLAGDFTTVGGVTRNRIARVDAAGKLDLGFNPNANGLVTCLAIQSDDRVVIGGSFTTVGGIVRNRIARLNAAGTLDPDFNPDANTTVSSLVIQADGGILTGGVFITLGGTARNRLARLLPSGRVDPAFDPNADNQVTGLALQADGSILVGGDFTAVGGVPRSRIARLPNNLAATQTLTVTNASQIDWQREGSASEVGQVTFETWDGSRWVNQGAAVRVVGGWRLAGLALLDTSWVRANGWNHAGGGNASTFAVTQSAAYGSGVLPNIVVQAEPGINLTSGHSTVAFGTTVWNTTPVSRTFTIGNQGNAPLTGLTISVGELNAADFSIGNLGSTTLAPGASTTFSTSLVPLGGGDRAAVVSIASNAGNASPFTFSVTGTSIYQDHDFSPTINGAVACIASQPDGKVLVGGDFTNVAGESHSCLVRLNGDGSVDTSFDPNVVNGAIACVAVQTDGKIVIGGYFTAVGGVPRNRVARLLENGALDASFDPEANDSVWCAAIPTDGKILLGGNFTTMGGVTRNRLARLNADGTLDSAFNPNAGFPIHCLAVQADDRILAGGSFTTMGGVARSRLARLNADGTLDGTMNPNVDNTVRSLAIQPDGSVLLGGDFTTVGSVARKRLARLNPDGSLDGSFNPNVGAAVNSMALQTNGAILVGGQFITVGKVPRKHLARLHADGNLDAAFDPTANGDVMSLALRTDGRILAGGDFSTLGGVTCSGFASIPNNTMAAGSLAATGTTQLDWMRDGAAPEVEQVTFELWNGAAWEIQAAALRIAGGWRAAGLHLPTGGWLRARGRSSDGVNSSLIEQVVAFGAGDVADLAVEDPAGTELTNAGSPSAFGSHPIGDATTLTFTIRNRGSADLTGLTLDGSGAAAAGFMAGPLATTSLAPGVSATFSVTFSPQVLGPSTAAIRIISNALDESPFLIGLTGTGGGSGEIAMELADGTELTSWAMLNFGSGPPGGTIPAVVTVRNLGNHSLNLGRVTLTGANAGDFLPANGLPASLAPGAQAIWTLTFNPAGAGLRHAALRLSNDDPDEGQFELNLTGISETPPALVLLPDGRVCISFQGFPDGRYLVERTTDLTVWTILAAVTADAAGMVEFTDAAPPLGRGFYRLRKP